MDARAIVGRRIRERREELGLSQEVFADKMGTSYQQVSRIERGERDIRLSTLIQFASFVGTSASELVRDL